MEEMDEKQNGATNAENCSDGGCLEAVRTVVPEKKENVEIKGQMITDWGRIIGEDPEAVLVLVKSIFRAK
jgi:hypothetical protein